MMVVGKIVLAILFAMLCGILHVILHEAGHLLCGLATGYRMPLQEDQGHLEKARKIAEEIMAFDSKLPPIFALEVGAERVMLELMTSNRKEVVDALWTESLQKYTLTNSQYSPIKLAVLYAVELIHLQNRAKAETYRQTLVRNRDAFTMPGEAATALYLIDRQCQMSNVKCQFEAICNCT